MEGSLHARCRQIAGELAALLHLRGPTRLAILDIPYLVVVLRFPPGMCLAALYCGAAAATGSGSSSALDCLIESCRVDGVYAHRSKKIRNTEIHTLLHSRHTEYARKREEVCPCCAARCYLPMPSPAQP
jgi:hypothetical protein